jgi:hypothetical protein
LRRGVTGHIASSITFIALVAHNPILCHPNIIIATDIHRTALFDQTMEFRNEIEHAHAIPPFRIKGIPLPFSGRRPSTKTQAAVGRSTSASSRGTFSSNLCFKKAECQGMDSNKPI